MIQIIFFTVLLFLLFIINKKLNKIINLIDNNKNKINIKYIKDTYNNKLKDNTNFGHYDFIRSDLGKSGNSLNSKIKNI